MLLGEADTRAKLIDPAIHARGWTEDLIRREETAGAITIADDGTPRKQARGRVDYILRVKVNPDTQPVAVAILEAKAEDLPPAHGLEQAKGTLPASASTFSPSSPATATSSWSSTARPERLPRLVPWPRSRRRPISVPATRPQSDSA